MAIDFTGGSTGCTLVTAAAGLSGESDGLPDGSSASSDMKAVGLAGGMAVEAVVMGVSTASISVVATAGCPGAVGGWKSIPDLSVFAAQSTATDLLP
ncbi:MAG: hypothetical protein HQL52_17545 [Magnetococcales bacterium]|nr:hypothetical protein [Magnetococcales bacterium]